MGLASKFRPDAAAAPLGFGLPHTFRVLSSIVMTRRNVVPGTKPRSKENSEGGPRSHLHRVRGSLYWSLRVAPCLLAPSNANGGSLQTFYFEWLTLARFQRNCFLVGVPDPKFWSLWVTPNAFGDVWRVLLPPFLNKAAFKKRGNISHALYVTMNVVKNM